MGVKPYRYHVFVCTAAPTGDGQRCVDKGSEQLRERFWVELEARQIDYVKVTRMGCTVQHKNGPIVVVYPGGTWYGHVQQEDIGEIIDQHLVAGKVVERLVHHQME